jgi:glycosyltransferase involved in cell wall biosynthesis
MVKHENKSVKIAIVHDWLTNMGGSELVVSNFLEMFPDATVYTSMYEPKKLNKTLAQANVKTSFLQRLPQKLRKQQMLLPLMPLAFEQFDLSEYDLVISSNSSCSKGIITGVNTLHICYCHSPMRYAWDFYHEYMNTLTGPKSWVAPLLMHKIRQWDRLSADRVDEFIANSSTIQSRIAKHYRRGSAVIFPPVDVERFDATLPREEFYLVVSRLVAYKRVDLAVEACTAMGKPLVVIGDGEERGKLEKLAGPTVKFLGRLPDDVVNSYMAKAKGFLFPGEEDFGITMVEAQAAGSPVIAYKRGGARDIVIDGKTGLFFPEQSSESLVEALLNFERLSFDGVELREYAQKFCRERFQQQIFEFIANQAETRDLDWAKAFKQDKI